MKITLISLPSNQWLATSNGLGNYAKWDQGRVLRDSDFGIGASPAFKSELRKQLKKAQMRVGSQP